MFLLPFKKNLGAISVESFTVVIQAAKEQGHVENILHFFFAISSQRGNSLYKNQANSLPTIWS